MSQDNGNQKPTRIPSKKEMDDRLIGLAVQAYQMIPPGGSIMVSIVEDVKIQLPGRPQNLKETIITIHRPADVKKFNVNVRPV